MDFVEAKIGIIFKQRQTKNMISLYALESDAPANTTYASVDSQPADYTLYSTQ